MSSFSPILRKIQIDLADNRAKTYSPTGKYVGPKGGRFNYTLVDDPNYHPERTSINKDKFSAGIRAAVTKGLIKPGDLVLDYGGGKYDSGKNHIESNVEGSEVHIYDPFSRDETHNNAVMDRFKNQKADVVMNHNVLNVIPSKEERALVMQRAFDHVKPGGKLLVTVYIGDKKKRGVPGKVIDEKTGNWNWQENRTTKDYIPEIQEALPGSKIERKGNLIIVHKE